MCIDIERFCCSSEINSNFYGTDFLFLLRFSMKSKHSGHKL